MTRRRVQGRKGNSDQSRRRAARGANAVKCSREAQRHLAAMEERIRIAQIRLDRAAARA